METKNTANEKMRETTAEKKPYKAPSFRFQTAFEVSALACGKLAGTGGSCSSSKKTS